ncbi:unnamed protein product [Mycena citricolor]|uniref:NTF2-like protein n=1 Tax=Mycena citricolor TaxID=2018698 RepID=A0AAD2Q2N2_9AGAR|nr:unnamed protein product [Mycena citricolor]CAK5269306.1 unnamed protein product [Mycena citricolor]
MLSSPTPAPSGRFAPAPGGRLATSALRGAGMIDGDTTMRDVSGKPMGRKGADKHARRTRNPYYGASSSKTPGASRMLSTRMQVDSNLSDALSRGGRTTGRPRGNAVSGDRNTRAGQQAQPVIVARTAASKVRPVDRWMEIVKKRYDPQTRCLNLDSIVDDDLVRKHGLKTIGAFITDKEAAVIFKIAARQFKGAQEVQTLSLSNNGLTGAHLASLEKYLPKIVNLSLHNNNIRTIRELDCIASRRSKMEHLRELILTNNPVRDQEYQSGNAARFRNEIARRFPNLELLDQEPIAKIAFDVASTTTNTSVPAPSSTTFPVPMGGSFIDGVDSTLVTNFLSRFFPLLDTDRPRLADVYLPTATFSYSANTSIPARARIEGLHATLPNQKSLQWAPWHVQSDSRNLTRLANNKITTTLHTGPVDIVTALIKLPVTKHDITGAPENFCIDAFLAGVGLLVVVHGQFMEAPSAGLRSFDRTFMLVPSEEGSAAKRAGWDVAIVADQLTIRALSNSDAWAAGPMLVQATRDTNPPRTLRSLPADQQTLLNNIPEPQRSMVLQLSGQTNLNVQTSQDCLAKNGWNHDLALANFKQVEAQLGPTAFLSRP